MSSASRQVASPTLVRAAASVVGGLVATLLFTMMSLTFVDVVGRYFFNHPVQGSYEISEVLLAVTAFAALPLTTLRREHVTVSLLDKFLGRRVRAARELLVALVSVLALGGMSWRLWEQARTLAGYGDHSLYLHIPYAWVAYFMAAMAAVSVLVVCVLALAQLCAGLDRQQVTE